MYIEPEYRQGGWRSFVKEQRSACMAWQGILSAIQEALWRRPPSWQSSILSNAAIFLLGFPLVSAGLTPPGIASAFLLGTITWKAFGPSAFLLVACFFIMGTAVTKVKIKQKEKEGIAEKRRGKRGPSSVCGSSAAASVCAFGAISGLGGSTCSNIWHLGFVASFATKLNDTVSSEIGKAYGRTTYLVTTLKKVSRGTEGAISVEGTLSGLIASLFFCALAFGVNQVTFQDALICVFSSQIANVIESFAGATLQDKKGFKWLNNDIVNVLNVSAGAIIAIISSYMISLS